MLWKRDSRRVRVVQVKGNGEDGTSIERNWRDLLTGSRVLYGDFGELA